MIVVLGVGRETRELLGVLDRDEPGTEVLVLDEGPLTPGELPPTPRLVVDVRGGVDLDREDALPRDLDEVYRSPGISPYRPALRRAIERGVPTTTPTGRWARQREGSDVIALSGTKGKSTTAALTAHLLRAAGRRVELVGNIGRSALSAGPAPDADDVVLELSSYQLADMDARFGLTGITTLLRDHVPWHGTVERYHRDKLRLLELSDRSIVDPQVAAHPAATAATARSGIATTAAHDRLRGALSEAGLVGEHLVRDAALALALVDARLGRPAGVSDLIASLHDFVPLPHRLTPVREVDGVTFVDDSISTVPESAVAAARTYRSLGPVTVLLGGDDRGQELAPLVQLLGDDAVRAVLLPPLGDRLHSELAPVAGDRVRRADDLAGAVTIAIEVTPPGGAVVLSPAAPSFTTYRDFVARGEHFVALVRALDPGSPV